jgi:hypothetical protein
MIGAISVLIRAIRGRVFCATMRQAEHRRAVDPA